MDRGRRLFRGTTIDWQGNLSLRQFELTPTTTDPFIATLFALECRRHGSAVIYSVDLADVAHLIAPANVLAELEREIVVNVAPMRFIRDFNSWKIPVETACQVLVELGVELPGVISNKYHLQKVLEDARGNRRALPMTTIDAFNSRLEALQ